TMTGTRGSSLTTWTPRPRLLRHDTWRGCGRNTSGACNEMVCALPTGGLARKPTDLARRPRNWCSPSRFVESRIPSNCLNRALFGSLAPARLGGLASSAIMAGLGGGLDLQLAGTWPDSHLVIAHDACSHQGGGASSVAGAHCQSMPINRELLCF